MEQKYYELTLYDQWSLIIDHHDDVADGGDQHGHNVDDDDY